MTIEKSGDRSVHSETAEGKSETEFRVREFHVFGTDGVEHSRIGGNATLKPPVLNRDTDHGSLENERVPICSILDIRATTTALPAARKLPMAWSHRRVVQNKTVCPGANLYNGT